MHCKSCGEQIELEDVITDIAAHDEEKLDITLHCCACGADFCAFVSADDIVQVGEVSHDQV